MTTTLLNRLQGAARAAMPTRSPRVQATARIRRETGCNHDDAVSVLRLSEKIVAEGRKNAAGIFYPSSEMLRSRAYRLFNMVVPHDQTSAEGSAHQAIEAVVLDPKRGEYALVHEEREIGGDRHCSMRTCIHTLS